MNTKICTSIEQSKKLLSLGLDPSTSDMYYCMWRKPSLFVGSYERANFINGDNKAVPTWSLIALLELMPRIIPNEGILCITPSHKDDGWVVGYNEDNTSFPTLIDAAFEMVCWLIEQGFIKVNK